MEYSKNVKLNKALKEIESDLLELGLDEVKRYYNDFKYEADYNIAQYGNLLLYYNDVKSHRFFVSLHIINKDCYDRGRK